MGGGGTDRGTAGGHGSEGGHGRAARGPWARGGTGPRQPRAMGRLAADEREMPPAAAMGA